MQSQEREPACRRRSNRGDCSTEDAPPSSFLAVTDKAAMQSSAGGRVRSSVPWSVPAQERWSLLVPFPPCYKPTAALQTPDRLLQFELSWCFVSSESSQHAQHTADCVCKQTVRTREGVSKPANTASRPRRLKPTPTLGQQLVGIGFSRCAKRRFPDF